MPLLVSAACATYHADDRTAVAELFDLAGFLPSVGEPRLGLLEELLGC